MGNSQMQNMSKFILLGIVCFLSYKALTYRSGASATNDSTLFYVGTYINPSSSQEPSIFLYELTSNGELNLISSSNGGNSPSYMTVSRDNEYLYAVNELDNGQLAAFKINKDKKGSLTLINNVLTRGSAPCHVSLDESETFAMVSNYNSGSLSVFPIDKVTKKLGSDGMVFIQHQGSGPNKDRQASAHAHSCFMHKSNKYAFSVDLGADSIFVYENSREKSILNPDPVQTHKEVPGSGPRHLVFNRAGNVIYVVSELDNTVSVLLFDPVSKNIQRVQKISTLPPDFKGFNGCAAIKMSSDGRFIYASNRGHDSIAVFAVNQDNVTLKFIGTYGTRGSFPRDFSLDKSEKFLIVACQNDNVINIFRRNQEDGTLEFTGTRVNLEKPVNICLLH